MRITKNQLRRIIKEELAGVLKEGLSDIDLKLGGGGGGAVEKRMGDYDPYTVGELGSDIKAGIGKVSSFFGGGADEPRAIEAVQADIDATNAALKSGEMSQLDAAAALAKLGREKSDITGVSIGQEPGSLEGLAGVREAKRRRKTRKTRKR